MTEDAERAEATETHDNVEEPTARELDWQALADELTPVKSLARIDYASSRVATNVVVIGVLASGFGVVGTSLQISDTLVKVLSLATTITAVIAVALALAGQLLTIRRGVNPRNLLAVQQWYIGQFKRRAMPVRAATALLVISVGLAGSTAVAYASASASPQLSIALGEVLVAPEGQGGQMLSKSSAIIEVKARGLKGLEVVAVSVDAASNGQPMRNLVRALLTPDFDGTVTRSFTASLPDIGNYLTVTATTPDKDCIAVLDKDSNIKPAVTCRDR